MDRHTKIICFGSVFAGLILLLLSIYYMPHARYTKTEVNLTTIISIIAIAAGVINFFIDSKGYEKHVSKTYKVLEDNKIIKVNNYALFTIIVLLSMLISALFINRRGDFLVFYVSSSVLIVALIAVQYHKGLRKLARR